MSFETTTIIESVTATLTPATLHPVLDVEAVKSWLVDKLENDALLRPLLGTSTTDSRVYWYYAPGAIIDNSKRAYITYAHTALPEATQAVEEPVFTLAIWALNIQAMRPVRLRLVKLLSERPLYLADGTEFWGTKVTERDSFQENTKFTGKQLVYRFGFSKV